MSLQRTLTYQQSQSRRGCFNRTAELRDFYPQGTFEDLTNFSVPIDPTWESAGHYDVSDEFVPEGERLVDPLFGSAVDLVRLNSPHAEQVRRFREKWKVEVARLTELVDDLKTSHKNLQQEIQAEYDAPTYAGSQHHDPPVYNWRIREGYDALASATRRLSEARGKLTHWNNRL
jgi:hypothetical protein